MDDYGTNRANQRQMSSNNNNRYNFNNLTNQACQSNNEIFYTPTESNWNLKRKRKISGISFQKNNQERFGFPQVFTSGCPHNTANLYLNKKNFSFKKKDTTKKNNYYDKEKLYQNMMKLQTSLNILNQKYQKQKKENDKQAKEIERQNKFLNYLNEKNLRSKNMDIYAKSNLYGTDLFNSDNTYNNELKPEDNIIDKKDKERDNLIKNLTMTNDLEYESRKFIKLNEQKFNLNSLSNNNKKYSLRDLYNELYNECKKRDKLLIKNEKEKEKYIQENNILKVANETLISNLKRQMKRLEADNEKKDLEIKDLKKNIKCSRYKELLKENEVLNFEMDKLKNKLNDAFKLINDYKKQEEEIKKLYEVIKKKDFKIKALELELMTLSNNSDETTKKLQDEIIVKDKLLKKQDRDMKKSAFEKYALMQGQNIDDINQNKNININNMTDKKLSWTKLSEMNRNDIIKNSPQIYQLYIEMKHKKIESSKNFNNEVLKKIGDVININEAKIIYCDLLFNYFNINNSDNKAKEVIMDLANKEFINNKNIFEIKKKQIRILDFLFNKNNPQKSLELLKSYIDENNLEEIINRTLIELDKKKLGYITFDEMKKVIVDVKLNDFLEEILLLTKSEIFNRIDYYNLLVLFNINNNIDIKNYVQFKEENIFDNNNNNPNIEKDATLKENNDTGIHDIKDNNNNNENLLVNNEIDNKNEIPIYNNKENENNEDVNNNNENPNNKDINNIDEGNNNNLENEHKDTNNEIKEENKKDEKEIIPALNELEKKLKIFVHNIKKKGSSLNNFISHLKESLNINNNTIEVINIIKLKEFLKEKNIELKDEETSLLMQQFKVNENNEENNYNDFINYNLFEQKLLQIIQNDSENDEDFMENIPVMEIDGME